MSNARNIARLLPNTSGQLSSTHLQDGSIVSSKIASGAVLPLNLPASSIVGFIQTTIQPSNDSYTNIAADTDYQTQLSLTYTPKFANSLLYIHAEHQCRMVAAYAMSGKIRRDGSNVNGSYNRGDLYFDYKGDQVNHHNNVVCDTVTTANNTNATTFTMWVQPYGGIGEVNNGWGNRFMYIMEIKQ
jgi:hypothetical protein